MQEILTLDYNVSTSLDLSRDSLSLGVLTSVRKHLAIFNDQITSAISGNILGGGVVVGGWGEGKRYANSTVIFKMNNTFYVAN